jgi:hypothetical protein
MGGNDSEMMVGENIDNKKRLTLVAPRQLKELQPG